MNYIAKVWALSTASFSATCPLLFDGPYKASELQDCLGRVGGIQTQTRGFVSDHLSITQSCVHSLHLLQRLPGAGAGPGAPENTEAAWSWGRTRG